MVNEEKEEEKYTGEKCTICGRLFKWVGMSPIEGICLHCFMGDKE